MPQALLLELDVLVVGARSARRAALARALAAERSEPGDDAPADRLERAATMSAAEGARILLAPADATREPLDETLVDLVALRAGALYRAWLAQGVTLADGAAGLVRDAATHAPVAVVTRGTREEAAFVLALAGLDDAVRCVVAAEDAARAPGEAHAVALERLARRRPIDVARVLALHDAAAGLRRARAVGAIAIACGDVPPHEAAEADAWVPSLAGHTVASLASLATPAARRTA